MAAGSLSERFRVGDWLVEPALNRISSGDREIDLEPKVMELLVFLAEHAGETLSRQQLVDTIWANQVVVEAALTRCVSELRRSLADDPHDPVYIQTVAKKGYRLIAPVVSESIQPDAPRPITRMNWPGPAAMGAVLLLVMLAWYGYSQRDIEPGAPIRSIAVLPLDDLSETGGREYFTDGMTELLITGLAKVPGLRVISRTSASRYRNSDRSVPEIAEELGVDAIVEGSVLQTGDRVRIVVQLIAAKEDDHLWAESYDRELKDILHLQSDLVRAVVEEIRIRLSPGFQHQIARTAGEINPEAYDLYLKGRHHWDQPTPGNLLSAHEHFQRAVELDPEFAPGQAAVAEALVTMPVLGLRWGSSAYPQARDAARRALELDPNLATAHATQAAVDQLLDWNWERAEAGYRRAIELSPGAVRSYLWYSAFLAEMGRFEEARIQLEQAERLDPFSSMVQMFWGFALLKAGDADGAVRRLQHAIDLDPLAAWITRRLLANAYVWLGREAEAVAEWRKIMRAHGIEEAHLQDFDSATAESGMVGFWRWWQGYHEADIEAGNISPVLLAEAYSAVGERELAVAQAMAAVDQQDGFLMQLSTSPHLASLASDPAFSALLEAAGLGQLFVAPGAQESSRNQ